MDEYIWPLREGKERWYQRDDRFFKTETDEGTYFHDKCSLDALDIRICPSLACSKNTLYPREFNFCPNCGDKLTPSITQSPYAWSPPYGNPNGCRLLSDYYWPIDCSEDILGNKELFKLPGEGRFSFVVPRDNLMLLAVEKEHGLLYNYSVTLNQWLEFGSIDAEDSPPWCWCASLGIHGIVLPTKNHPTWIALPTGMEPKFNTTKLPKTDPIYCLGGSCFSAQKFFLPIIISDQIQIAFCIDNKNTEWSIHQVQKSEDFNQVKDKYLGCPVRNTAGNIFWSGRKGYLAVDISNSTVSATWIKWDSGTEGRPQYIPFRDNHGTVWQLVFSTKLSRYQFQKLLTDRLAKEKVKMVLGPHLVSGSYSFKDDKRYDQPWLDQTESGLDFEPAQEIFIHPLLEIKNGLFYIHSDKMSSVAKFMEGQMPIKGTLMFRQNSGGDISLVHGLSLSNPWDASFFIFNGDLYLYLESQNRCWRWKI